MITFWNVCNAQFGPYCVRYILKLNIKTIQVYVLHTKEIIIAFIISIAILTIPMTISSPIMTTIPIMGTLLIRTTIPIMTIA
jgi:hypothetical protein